MSTGSDDQWTEVDRDRWGDYVMGWLRARKLTQAQAAAIIGVSESTMTAWKNGARPSIENAEAFGRDIGTGAEEGRRAGGYSAVEAVTMEDIHRELQEVKELLAEALDDHPLRTKIRRGVAMGRRADRRVPPL